MVVSAGNPTRRRRAFVVRFSIGFGWRDCLVSPGGANNDAYLRSLVQFMRYKLKSELR